MYIYNLFRFTIIIDDLSDDKYEVTSPWGRKKSRYLYTYNLQSPDLFSINDSDQTESIDSIQSKATSNNILQILILIFKFKAVLFFYTHPY